MDVFIAAFSGAVAWNLMTRGWHKGDGGGCSGRTGRRAGGWEGGRSSTRGEWSKAEKQPERKEVGTSQKKRSNPSILTIALVFQSRKRARARARAKGKGMGEGEPPPGAESWWSCPDDRRDTRESHYPQGKLSTHSPGRRLGRGGPRPRRRGRVLDEWRQR
jgi:hypothetical protein